MLRRMPRSWGDIQRDWPILTAYQRFETAVAFLLTIVISTVIVVALYRLVTYWLMRERDDRMRRDRFREPSPCSGSAL